MQQQLAAGNANKRLGPTSTQAFTGSGGGNKSDNAHVSTAIPDRRARQLPSPTGSGRQYLVEDALGLEFVGAFCERQL